MGNDFLNNYDIKNIICRSDEDIQQLNRRIECQDTVPMIFGLIRECEPNLTQSQQMHN